MNPDASARYWIEFGLNDSLRGTYYTITVTVSIAAMDVETAIKQARGYIMAPEKWTTLKADRH